MNVFRAPTAAFVQIPLRALRAGVVVAAMVALLQGTASAAPLALDITAPDIAGFGISFAYNATNQAFEANGSVDMLDLGSSVLDIIGGAYELSAELDPVTQTATGLLRITGQVDGLGLLAGTRLLEGRIEKFGLDDSIAGKAGFQFVFDVVGGELSPLFGRKGGTNISRSELDFEESAAQIASGAVGVAPLSSGSSIFAQSFTGGGVTTTSDTVSVPEPALLTLGALGLGALARRRRARRHAPDSIAQ
jgi:uncharacterized protein (TIGR03382 family)